MPRRTLPFALLACALLASSGVPDLEAQQAPHRAEIGESVNAILRGGGSARVLVVTRDSLAALAGQTLPGARRDDGPVMDAARMTQILRGGGGAQVEATAERGVTAAVVTAQGLERLRANRDVVGIFENGRLYTTMAQTHPLMQVDRAHQNRILGTGTTIAVIDTGIDRTHPAFQDAIVGEACISTHDPDGQQPMRSICPDNRALVVGPGAAQSCQPRYDGCDHGTHVAGIAAGRAFTAVQGNQRVSAGVAPGARLYVVKAGNLTPERDRNGNVTWSHSFQDMHIINALAHIAEVARRHNIVAVNLSLGSSTRFPFNCDLGPGQRDLNPLYAAVVRRLADMGIAVIAAAGNQGTRAGVGRPACLSNAVAVGSIDAQGAPFQGADTGIKVDFLAPGVNILSALDGGRAGTQTGTSMATPYVTGAIAAMRQLFPITEVPPQNLVDALRRTGRMVTDPRNGLVFPVPHIERAIDAMVLTRAAANVVDPQRPPPAAAGAGTPQPAPAPEPPPPAQAPPPPAPADGQPGRILIR